MKILIDPYKITNYKRSKNELEEFLLFCIVVAGKTAYIQSQKLDEFLTSINKRLMMPEKSVFLGQPQNMLYAVDVCVGGGGGSEEEVRGRR